MKTRAKVTWNNSLIMIVGFCIGVALAERANRRDRIARARAFIQGVLAEIREESRK